MTDRDIVDRVADLLGRATVPLRVRMTHHKQPFVTQIKGAPAVELMRSVQQFLGVSRQTEIQRAVASWHGRRRRWHPTREPCRVEHCTGRIAVRGLCERHYDQWWKAHRRGRQTSIVPMDAPPEGFALRAGSVCDEECDVAWLAGLLEGEGTFGMTGRPPLTYPYISLPMCDFDIVSRAARMLAASVTRSDPDHDNWSPVYRAQISGNEAAIWMRRLRPLMGLRRGAAIDRALTAYRPIRLVDPPGTCVVGGCNSPHRSRGLCHKHYMSWSRDVKKGRVPRVTPLR